MKSIFLIVGLMLCYSAQTQAADAVAGKAKYDMFCSTCHGPQGLGDGAASAALNPKPRNLQATVKTDDELKKVIKEGGAANGLSATMVAWSGVLSDTDIDNVIAYIRSLKK